MGDPVVDRIVRKMYETEPDPAIWDDGSQELVLELLEGYKRQMHRRVQANEASPRVERADQAATDRVLLSIATHAHERVTRWGLGRAGN